MGSITRHRAAVKVNSKRTVSTHLQIVINDVTYRVNRIDPGEEGTIAIRLEKQGGKADVYDLIRDNHGLIRCDCPSYESTYAGTTSTCKHGQALVITGLMSAPHFVPATNGPVFAPSPDELTEAPAEAPALAFDPTDVVFGARVRHKVAEGTWKVVAAGTSSPTIRVRQFAENGSLTGSVQTWTRDVVGGIVTDEPAPGEAPCCVVEEPAPCQTCITPTPPADEPIVHQPHDVDAIEGTDDEHLANAAPADWRDDERWTLTRSCSPDPADMRAALDTAVRIMERDGIQELRGLAWTDDELEQMRAALAPAPEPARLDFPAWIESKSLEHARIGGERHGWLAAQIAKLAKQARWLDAKDPADYDDRADVFGLLTDMADADEPSAEDLDDSWRDSPEYAW